MVYKEITGILGTLNVAKKSTQSWYSSSGDRVSWLKFWDCIDLGRWWKEYSMQRQIIKDKTVQGTKKYNMAGLAVGVEIAKVLRYLRGNFIISYSK